MNTSEIKHLIAENGFHPIPVLSGDDDDERENPRFDGTIEEFWPALKALKAIAVFVNVLRLDESDFGRPPPEDAPYEESDEDEFDRSEDGEVVINLEDFVPSIKRFREHLGKECAFVLTAKGGAADLDILIQVDWWKEFLEDADKAVELWTAKQEKLREMADAETEEQEQELLKTLRGLISDKAFCVLPTQRAMKAYALENHPELDDLSEHVIKTEIQALHDKIQTKGLN